VKERNKQTNKCFLSYLQMVMEFSDDVTSLDSQHINSPRWKRFAEVISLTVTPACS